MKRAGALTPPVHQAGEKKKERPHSPSVLVELNGDTVDPTSEPTGNHKASFSLYQPACRKRIKRFIFVNGDEVQ